MIDRSSTTRVLAIDPTTRGFSYVVFEGSEFLLEWGLSQVGTDKKNAKCVDKIDKLIDRYAPEVIVLEDYAGPGSHRRRRVRALIRSIEGLATRRGIRERTFSRGDIKRAFPTLPDTTKYSIATELSKRYPELARRLPAERKCYESEDERTNLFDAASLAVTYFEKLARREKPALREAA